MARTDFGSLPRQNPCAQCGEPIGVPEWIEPVVRELDPLRAAGSPRGGPGVLQAEPCADRHARSRLAELAGEPAGRDRTCRYGMLTDPLHVPG